MAAFLMNDTLAIIGTPVVLLLAGKAKTSPKILLLTLAFAVTIGSVTSPIGNPQNCSSPSMAMWPILLSLSSVISCSRQLLNLLLAYFLLRLFYRKQFDHKIITSQLEPINDPKLAQLCRISLVLLAVLIVAKIVTDLPVCKLISG